MSRNSAAEKGFGDWSLFGASMTFVSGSELASDTGMRPAHPEQWAGEGGVGSPLIMAMDMAGRRAI
ncbi:MAG: hypothetical protein WHX93_09820 [bacterium]